MAAKSVFFAVLMFCTIIMMETVVSGQLLLTYRVSDELQSGTLIADLRNDSGAVKRYGRQEASKLTFAFLTQGELTSLFGLDEALGLLTAARYIDRDQLCPYAPNCTIQLAVAIQPAQFFLEIKITIIFADVNDMVPTFPSDTLPESLSESTPVGTLIPLPTANDVDGPPFGVQRYELIDDSQTFVLNVVNSSRARGGSGGATALTFDISLKLVKPLNREVRDTYRLVVKAYDGGSPPHVGSLVVDVTVQDENDNSPRFDNSVYNAEVRENTTLSRPLVTVHAVDPDLGDNGAIKYSLVTSSADCCPDAFRLDARTGDIFLQQPLDFEKQSLYTIHVTASDLGSGSIASNAKVIVKVTDVNDNKPNIVTNGDVGDVTVSVSEGVSPGAFVAHVSVTDGDSGRNGEVECALTETDEFVMDQMYASEYKIVTTRMLDRETQTRYHIEIICHDLGVPRLTSSAMIDVEVMDINDNAPVFAQTEYVVMLAENSDIGTQVLRVEARDADSGSNGTVRYRLDRNAGITFGIDSQTGIIRTTSPVDREMTDTYVFSVVAQDMGQDAKSATAVVTVTITDVDDQAPRFSQRNYAFYVDENLQPDTEIDKVVATDADLAPNNAFSFYLDPKFSPTDALRIDPKTGIIYTRKPLDREDVPSFSAVVIVQSDSGSALSDHANVIVFVNDRNDNSPIITFPSGVNNSAQVNSRAPLGHVVTRVEATDADDAKNGELSYEIQSTGDPATQLYHIDSESGTVVVNADLSSYDQKAFLLHVVVKDNGTPQRVASAVLSIVVNSSAPLYTGRQPLVIGVDGGLLAHKTSSSRNTQLVIGTYLAAIISASIATCLLLILVVTVLVCVSSRRRHRRHVDKRSVVRVHGGASNAGSGCGTGRNNSPEPNESTQLNGGGDHMMNMIGGTTDLWEERRDGRSHVHNMSGHAHMTNLDKQLSVDVPDITLSLCPLQNVEQKQRQTDSMTRRHHSHQQQHPYVQQQPQQLGGDKADTDSGCSAGSVQDEHADSCCTGSFRSLPAADPLVGEFAISALSQLQSRPTSYTASRPLSPPSHHGRHLMIAPPQSAFAEWQQQQQHYEDNGDIGSLPWQPHHGANKKSVRFSADNALATSGHVTTLSQSQAGRQLSSPTNADVVRVSSPVCVRLDRSPSRQYLIPSPPPPTSAYNGQRTMATLPTSSHQFGNDHMQLLNTSSAAHNAALRDVGARSPRLQNGTMTSTLPRDMRRSPAVGMNACECRNNTNLSVV